VLLKFGKMVLICASLAACAGATDESNTIVTPSGKVVQAPPANLRQGLSTDGRN
jgi:hypothetical protein